MKPGPNIRKTILAGLGVQKSPGCYADSRSALQLAADIGAPLECREALLEVALSAHGAARPAPFASRSVQRTLLTPRVNPGSRYHRGRGH